MTNVDVSEDVRAVVEDTELPERLRTRIYETVAERDDVTPAQVEQVAQAVESRYIETRVDPLDPVGTVSAQSIGEPGTQMSIPADEEILVRRNGQTETIEIGELVDSAMNDRQTRQFNDHEVALAPENLAVPSLNDDETIDWATVDEVSRHKTPEELLRFELTSGRTITATAGHSFVTRRDGDVIPVEGSELSAGDYLPVMGSLPVHNGVGELNLRKYLPESEYWYTAALTDGGEVTVPGSPEQKKNRQASLEAGDIDDEAVYPVGGTVGLPASFPLDEETGFFVGAWLAEGNATDHYVSLSNTDPAFCENLRSFASRFELTVNEYEGHGEFGESQDIRINGTIVADLLRETCVKNGEKVVPGFAFGANEEFVVGLLRGYLSGDGNVADAAVRSSSTSNRLTTGIALLLTRVGVYATLGQQEDSRTLRVPAKFVPRVANRIGMVGERGEKLAEAVQSIDADGQDATDQIPGIADAVTSVASDLGLPSRQFNSAANRDRAGRNRLAKLVTAAEEAGIDSTAVDQLKQAVNSDVVWDQIERIETVSSDHEYVYDLSVAGLETFTTAEGVITHNTMNTFHYAGVAEIDVTQGLPRLIELVDARKTPDTPMMTVHLEEEYATDRERTHEVVWQIEATKILALGDISTNVADMVVQVDLNEETLRERWPTYEETEEIAAEIGETIQSKLGVETNRRGTVIQFGPDQPSYRELLQLVEELRDIVFKGIEEISRVVIRKEDRPDDEEDEFVLYTEGSAFGDVIEIEGVDATRTTCNNIHEIRDTLGIEAAREAIINETMDTLEEQGLGDVNIRHLMLVADIMTNTGEIESIGRHGISGSKNSVLARAAFEVTVSHLLDAAVYGEVDELDGVTENVIVGKPIKLGTGDVNLRMRANDIGDDAESADD